MHGETSKNVVDSLITECKICLVSFWKDIKKYMIP